LEKIKKYKALSYLIASFLDNIGDYIFLSSIPLFFYKWGGDSVLFSTFVSVLITVVILIGRKTMINFSRINPLDLVFRGELTMGSIEIAFLVLFSITHFEWLVLVLFVVLALIYNLYAPTKIYRLQEFFFHEKLEYYTSIQSSLNKIGILIGIGLSGYILEKFGIKGVLICDALGFFIFALMLFFYKNEKIVSKVIENKVAEENNDSLKNAVLFFIIIIAYSLFISWGQSTLLPTLNKVTGKSFTELSILRATLSILGMIVTLILIKKNVKLINKLSLLAMFSVTIISPVLVFVSPEIYMTFLFFIFGVLATVSTSFSKSIFKVLDKKNYFNGQNTATIYWIYSSLLKFTLPLYGLFIDTYVSLSFYAYSIWLMTVISTIFVLLIVFFSKDFNLKLIKKGV
jgi:MFS family permease